MIRRKKLLEIAAEFPVSGARFVGRLYFTTVHDCQNRTQFHATRHYQAIFLEIYPEYTQ